MVTPWRAPVPVVCVGNITVGGTGKTPVAINIGERLAARGLAVHFVSRGYGGRDSGPLQVDPARHGADDVGDEPLLLARVRPTWIARDRPAAVRAAVDAGAAAVVMDDGLQNPTIVKDLSFVVVDGGRGFGNGLIVPAGPLREPIAAALGRAHAVVVVGDDTAGVAASVGRLPSLRASLEPTPMAYRLQGRRVIAFAGIGDPEKFFATLESLGCRLAATRSFADHHRYRDGEVASIIADGRRLDAVPVTTAKDAVRLPEGLRSQIEVLSVTVTWHDPPALDRLLRRLGSDAG
jgi:tetraacyldisaccharide 4'-kinase